MSTTKSAGIQIQLQNWEDGQRDDAPRERELRLNRNACTGGGNLMRNAMIKYRKKGWERKLVQDPDWDSGGSQFVSQSQTLT